MDTLRLHIFFSTATILVLGLISSCSNKTDVVIKGNLSNLESEVKVILLQQEFDRVFPIDSLSLTTKKSKFKFVVKGLVEPTFLQLKVVSPKVNTAVLLVETGEKVTINIDVKSFSQYQINGSEGSEMTRLLSNRLANTTRTLDSLSKLIRSNPIETEKLRIEQEYVAAIDSQRAFSTRFIVKNAMSRASVMAVYQQLGNNRFVFDRSEDISLLRVVATSLKAQFPESGYTKGILADIQNQERRLFTHRLSNIIAEAENNLPEIALPNHKGDTIVLSSLRGRLILLSFWASGNQSSLFENQELKEIYSNYKTKGFEIYQVSLDKNPRAWLEKVVSTDIPWISVCDYNPNGSYAAKLYNVTSIPTNYLINKNYEIVAKNLYGKDLERKIKELL